MKNQWHPENLPENGHREITYNTQMTGGGQVNGVKTIAAQGKT